MDVWHAMLGSLLVISLVCFWLDHTAMWKARMTLLGVVDLLQDELKDARSQVDSLEDTTELNELELGYLSRRCAELDKAVADASAALSVISTVCCDERI